MRMKRRFSGDLPDVPEALTGDGSLEEARLWAVDSLNEALDGYMVSEGSSPFGAGLTLSGRRLPPSRPTA